MDSAETIDTGKPPGWVETARAGLEVRFRKLLNPFILLLQRLGIKPNQVTLVELFVNLLVVGFLLNGWLVTAGILFLLAGVFDVVDGSLARLTRQVTPYGAFLDSTIDRVSEGIIFAAIAYRFTFTGESLAVVCVILALMGAMLTSYTRAKAESLGIACTVGLVSRSERVMLISAGLIFDQLVMIIYLLVALTAWTVLQRIYHVRRRLLSG
ncbi:CDP-alcohol phosphatidyltransferase family protein [candidate division KSB1 bacterium]